MSPKAEPDDAPEAPSDLRKVARDAGPIAAALAAVVTAIGGWGAAADLKAELRAQRGEITSLHDAVTRLEARGALGDGLEPRLREVEARERELDTRLKAVEARKEK